jgi:hypothetical protein
MRSEVKSGLSALDDTYGLYFLFDLELRVQSNNT